LTEIFELKSIPLPYPKPPNPPSPTIPFNAPVLPRVVNSEVRYSSSEDVPP